MPSASNPWTTFGGTSASEARPRIDFIASRADDFLQSGDKNFRPINLRWGPNGEIYCIDWHDQNPCHQAAPDSWDMTHGRIYKIQRTGTKARLDIKDLSLAADGPFLASRVAKKLGPCRS